MKDIKLTKNELEEMKSTLREMVSDQYSFDDISEDIEITVTKFNHKPYLSTIMYQEGNHVPYADTETTTFNDTNLICSLYDDDLSPAKAIKSSS